MIERWHGSLFQISDALDKNYLDFAFVVIQRAMFPLSCAHVQILLNLRGPRIKIIFCMQK